MSDRTFIIAEAGVNHNGDIALAEQLVESAAEAGADAVKFQTFNADLLVAKGTPKAAYQTSQSTEGRDQHEMLRALELAPDKHVHLKRLADEKGVEFMSAPFDAVSARFLTEEVGVDRIKIPSGEITNGPYLLEISKLGVPIVLSTGMSTLDDIEAALIVLSHGLMRREGVPSRESMDSAEGRSLLESRVALLHCTTQYPTPYSDLNLRAMDTLAQAFRLPVGLSDHSLDIFAPIGAVARGAQVIEKHFTLDRSLTGPDHAASLEVTEFSRMVEGIRAIESSLGSGEKEPVSCELENLEVARRSLVAARPVRKGELFTSENITAKRPAKGLSPMEYWHVVGREAERDYRIDEALDPWPNDAGGSETVS